MEREAQLGSGAAEPLGIQQVAPSHDDSPFSRVGRGLRGELGRVLVDPIPAAWHGLLHQLGEAEERHLGEAHTGPKV
ncbi:hypothetical protein [Alsobacter sp. SYSU BS001988]|jgi:hypothetical protein